MVLSSSTTRGRARFAGPAFDAGGDEPRGWSTGTGQWRLLARAVAPWVAAFTALALGVPALGLLDPAVRESPVPASAVPPAVRRAAGAYYPGTQLTGAAFVESRSAAFFELELLAAGGTLTASFTPAGEPREIEIGLAARDLPPAVAAALAASAQRGWPIRSVEAVRRADGTAPWLYEVSVVKRGTVLELWYDTKGTRVGARRLDARRAMQSAAPGSAGPEPGAKRRGRIRRAFRAGRRVGKRSGSGLRA